LNELKDAWREDDMFAWIMFLLFVLPMPFLYAYMQNLLPESSALMHTVYTFVLNGLLWGSLYGLKQKLQDNGEEEDGVPRT